MKEVNKKDSSDDSFNDEFKEDSLFNEFASDENRKLNYDFFNHLKKNFNEVIKENKIKKEETNERNNNIDKEKIIQSKKARYSEYEILINNVKKQLEESKKNIISQFENENKNCALKCKSEIKKDTSKGLFNPIENANKISQIKIKKRCTESARNSVTNNSYESLEQYSNIKTNDVFKQKSLNPIIHRTGLNQLLISQQNLVENKMKSIDKIRVENIKNCISLTVQNSPIFSQNRVDNNFQKCKKENANRDVINNSKKKTNEDIKSTFIKLYTSKIRKNDKNKDCFNKKSIMHPSKIIKSSKANLNKKRIGGEIISKNSKRRKTQKLQNAQKLDVNPTSIQYILKKFKRDFDLVIVKSKLGNSLNKDKFKLLIKELGFIKSENNISEENLIDNLFKILKSDDSKVNINDAFEAMQRILSNNSFTRKNISNRLEKKFSKYNLQKNFHLLYINRLSNSSRNSIIDQNCSSPENTKCRLKFLNKSLKISTSKSVKLLKELPLINQNEVDKKLETDLRKSCNKSTSTKNIKYLGIKESLSKKNKEKILKLSEESLNKKIFSECTFKPKTNIYSPKAFSPSKLLKKNSKKTIFEKLYNNYFRSKKRYFNEDKNKFNSELKECSFHPSIKSTNIFISNNTDSIYDKGSFDKYIERIRDAQEKKDILKNNDLTRLRGSTILRTGISQTNKNISNSVSMEIEEKGILKNQIEDTKKKSSKEFTLLDDIIKSPINLYSKKLQSEIDFEKYEEKIPLLYIDVNINENKCEKIVFNEGDSSLDLARRFAKKHSKLIRSRFQYSKPNQKIY